LAVFVHGQELRLAIPQITENLMGFFNRVGELAVTFGETQDKLVSQPGGAGWTALVPHFIQEINDGHGRLLLCLTKQYQ
jgi:hypothetical protein